MGEGELGTGTGEVDSVGTFLKRQNYATSKIIENSKIFAMIRYCVRYGPVAVFEHDQI